MEKKNKSKNWKIAKILKKIENGGLRWKSRKMLKKSMKVAEKFWECRKILVYADYFAKCWENHPYVEMSENFVKVE